MEELDQYSISQLTEATEVTDDDLVEVVIDTGTTPKSRKMKRSTLVDGLATEVSLTDHTTNTDNPHGVTKAQVGLSNVPNTDATQRSNHTGTQAINTITGLQAALDGKAATSHTQPASTITDFDAEVSNNTDVAANTAARHTHSNKTVLDNTTASFTTADESKLDGIATGATANSSDASLLNRSNHTGTQAISTVSGLQTALDGKADDAAVVHDTGNETVAGVKTFSASPIVPTPTTDMQAATKKYVDDELAAFEPGDSLPDQTGNNGKFLTTDGTDTSWADLPGGGDMAKATYDPGNISADAFDMDNMVEGDINKILTAAERADIASAVQPGDLATVATTGAYADLSGAPAIPNELTDLDTTVTGAQLNSLKTKVDGIESGAQVNDVNSVNGQTGAVSLDVDDVAPTQTGNSGKVLKTDGTNATWQDEASGGAETLDDLDDVTISSPTTGQALVYQGEGETPGWINGNVLSNPMTTKGDMIVGDTGGAPSRLPAGSTSQPHFLKTRGTSLSPAWSQVAIDDLANTTASSATEGQVLVKGGGEGVWAPETLADVAFSGDYADLSNTPEMPAGLDDFGVTASSSELNILDGATLSTAELNHVDGVTSPIQAQLDTKASTNHDHDTSYAPLSHASDTDNPHSVTADQVLPSQSGNSGKFLTTNGTTASWGTPEGGGGGGSAKPRHIITMPPSTLLDQDGGSGGTFSKADAREGLRWNVATSATRYGAGFKPRSSGLEISGLKNLSGSAWFEEQRPSGNDGLYGSMYYNWLMSGATSTIATTTTNQIAVEMQIFSGSQYALMYAIVGNGTNGTRTSLSVDIQNKAHFISWEWVNQGTGVDESIDFYVDGTLVTSFTNYLPNLVDNMTFLNHYFSLTQVNSQQLYFMVKDMQLQGDIY